MVIDETALDLPAYGKRIGFTGAFEPTFEVLKELVHRHACTIPFENLDVALGRQVKLDQLSLQNKLVYGNRGGYCFEQNGLVLEILRNIGFKVKPVAARVRRVPDRDAIPQRTHLFLLVDLDSQEWVVDLGVGGFSLTAPIKWELQTEQCTPHDSRRIVFEDERYFHQVCTGSEWHDVLETQLEPMFSIDREVASWYTSTHPESRFRNMLFCARAGENGERYGLLDCQYTHRRGPEVLETRKIQTGKELVQLLANVFNLHVPDISEEFQRFN